MVTCVATLDVLYHVVQYVARLLAAHRRRIGTPKGSRALGPFRQAVLVLRWFRARGCVHCLARDAGISQATGYGYLHEGINVLAERAPDLHKVLDRCRGEGMTHMILDGTLIECDRVAGVRDNGNDLWFSQKNKAFGGNVQLLAAPDGTPLWVSDAERVPPPDITTARLHALPALYKAAADGLPTLADKGHIGAGIRVPHRRPKGQSEQALHADNRTFNALVRHVRALGERAAAELKQRWRSLQYVTLSPLAAQWPEQCAGLMIMDFGLVGGSLTFDQLKPLSFHFSFFQQEPLFEQLVAGQERLFLSYFYQLLGAPAPQKNLDEYVRVYARPGALHNGSRYYQAWPQGEADNRRLMGKPLDMPVHIITQAQLFDVFHTALKDAAPAVASRAWGTGSCTRPPDGYSRRSRPFSTTRTEPVPSPPRITGRKSCWTMWRSRSPTWTRAQRSTTPSSHP